MRTDQTVLQAKRFGIFSCRQTTPLREAIQRMVEEDISALVVVDEEGFLEGIITRTDMLHALVELEDWENQPVGRFMVKDVITVPPQAHLVRVAELLLSKQIHRVVVVREEGGRKRPLSVVSDADLVYHMVSST